MKLAFDRGGQGGPLLVLLHGLGATRQVWKPMLGEISTRWNGSWIAPDLRGHGQSAPAQDYSLECHAYDVAELVCDRITRHSVIVLGHSMGGAVALALASGRFGFTPARVFGLGVKVMWSAQELAGMHKLAASPARVFATEGEAIARYLKVSGLGGLLAPDSPEARAGVMRTGHGWRLACDPATASVGPPAMERLLSAARCSIHLARGERDALVSLDELRAYDAGATDLAAADHNAMVQKPTAVWEWLLSHVRAQ